MSSTTSRDCRIPKERDLNAERHEQPCASLLLARCVCKIKHETNVS